MKKVLLYGLLLMLLPLRSLAQGEELTIIKGDCTPGLSEDTDNPRRASRRLPAPSTLWDKDRIYHQLVILFYFSDTEFLEEHTKEYYEKILNEAGYNEGEGLGCMADYFRAQSNGLLNLQLDVYGPYQVSTKACPSENPTSSTKYYGRDAMQDATNLFLVDHPEIDFSQYDWNGDGYVNQVLFINAGVSGNVFHTSAYGHIWPNTSSFATITTPDGKKISSYTISAEYFTIARSCGIGTVCHEFSHSLGLPDIYPVAKNQGYSVCDSWDLMDGGNYTNWGWCPPNFTALEKYLLGWVDFTELEEAASVVDMKPASEGGEVYRVKHSDSEWLLLENRQQIGWDAGSPGKGLVIYHVNYDGSVWRNNSVNNDKARRRFHLVYADNMDYDAWDDYISVNGLSTYVNNNRMNSRYLSTSPYPYISEDAVNNELTDDSTPPATMFYPNLDGNLQLGKPITNIQMTDEGLISFDFMGGTTDIKVLMKYPMIDERQVYDLSGRMVKMPQSGNIYIFRNPDGTAQKQVYHDAK